MGVWTQNSVNHVWTLTGDGVRTAVVSTAKLPANHAVRVQIDDPSNDCAVLILASADGRSGWEVYTDSGTGGNLRIRRVDFGVRAAFSATAAHGLTTGVPFLVEVRVLDGVIQARLNGKATATVSYDIIGAPVTTPGFAPGYLAYGYFGFASAASSIVRVLRADTVELRPKIAPAVSMLIAVCGGELWYALDDTMIARAATGVVGAENDVDATDHEQIVYLVDGQKARRFLTTTLTLENWTATAGTLPGATSAGTTRATVVENYLGRPWLGGDRQDPQNLFAPAIDDPLDFNTGSDLPGAAFALTSATAGRIGQPVRALTPCGDNAMMIGCAGSFWELRGDPALGNLSVQRVSADVGVSGPGAMALGDEGLIIAHTPDGMAAIPLGGRLEKVSQDLLTEIIEIDDAIRSYQVQVVRDPRRGGVHLFLTKRATAAVPEPASTHIWYDERGGFNPSAGGFFPERYPAHIGPTASCLWNGQVVLGGRDGYLYVFDDAAKSDCGRTPGAADVAIESRCVLGLVVDPAIDRDTILHRLELVLSEGSDAIDVTVYGGLTAEEAYEGADRWTLIPETEVTERIGIFAQTVRAPAIVVEISNDEVGSSFELEECQIVTSSAMLTRAKRVLSEAEDEEIETFDPVVPELYQSHPPAWSALHLESEELGTGEGSGWNPYQIGAGQFQSAVVVVELGIDSGVPEVPETRPETNWMLLGGGAGPEGGLELNPYQLGAGRWEVAVLATELALP